MQDPTILDVDALLNRVMTLISNAKSMPLSASVLINKEEILDLLQEAVQRMPEDVHHARRMLKEREDFQARTEREAGEILAAARDRAERMVARTEVVRQAELRAQRMIDDARAEAHRLRHDAEDYCDHKLAAFEIALDRTKKTVQAGREKLRTTPPPPEDDRQEDRSGALAEQLRAEEAFFDQDSS